MKHVMEKAEDEIFPRKKSPVYTLVALLTAVALFLLSIQAYFYLIRPEPVDIPELAEVQNLLGQSLEVPFSSHQSEAVRQVIEETRDTLKQVANYIASQSCREADSVCQSKALFYFVRDEISYVPRRSFPRSTRKSAHGAEDGGS